jgi:threonine dehydratase
VKDPPELDDVVRAMTRIAPHVHRTPVMTSAALDELVGCRVHLKCEHLQRAGAFKARGAMNAVLALDETRASRGVAAHSSGNHAAALALAARTRGIPCHVVMPTNTPEAKRLATAAYGAEITLCAPTLDARAETLAAVIERTGATEVHPYDDPWVIAGQGTATLELLDEVPGIGAVVAPVSGGGLLSGTAIAAQGANARVAVWGAEPANVDDAHRSLAAGVRTSGGNRTSIADGLLAVLSDRTFEIIRSRVDAIVTVSEAEIVAAMTFLFGRCKQVVEPSGATALAGVLALARSGSELPDDVGVILSGGNVDLDRLPFGPELPEETER